MSARQSSKWAAIATVSLLLPGPVLNRPAEQPRQCPATVDVADPLAVAGAVAAWLYCGPTASAPAVVSRHAMQVLNRPSGSRRLAAVSGLRFLDPRATPVVVLAVVRPLSDPGVDHLVLTLFRLPEGAWVVDDVALVDR